MSALNEFAARHWVIGGIVASLMWFYAGGQSISTKKAEEVTNKNVDAAVAWQCVAVMIVMIVSGWAIAESEWLGLAAGLIVLYVEIRGIRRTLALQKLGTS